MYSKVVSTISSQDGSNNQDITFTPTSGDPDWIPKIIILQWNRANTSADTFQEHCSYGKGFTDGTNQRCVAVASEDNQARGDTATIQRNNALICALSPTGTVTGVDAVAVFSQWLTNGVRINWSTVPSAQFYLTVMFLGGQDITNINIGTLMTGTSTGDISVNTLSYQGDYLMVLNSMTATENSGVVNGFISEGHAISNSAQHCQSYYALDNPATMSVRTYFSNNKIAVSHDTAMIGYASFTSFNSNGFTLTVGDAFATSIPLYYLIIKGGQFAVGSVSEPGSPQQQTVTTNKDVKALMILLAFGSNDSIQISAGRWSSGMATATDNQCVDVFHDTDGSADSVVVSRHDTNQLVMRITANATATSSTFDDEAAFYSKSATNFVVDWTNTGSGMIYRWVTYGGENLGTVTKSLTLKWNEIGQVTKQLTLKQDIRKEITKTNTLRWNINNAVTKQLTLIFNVIGQTVKTLTLLQNIIQETTKTLTLIQNISAPITKSTTLKFNVNKEVTKSLSLLFDIEQEQLQSVTKSLTLLFSGVNQVSKTLSLLFSLNNEVTKPTTLLFDVNNEVEKDISLIFSGLNETTKSLSLIFNGIAEVVKALTLRFDELAEATKSLNVKFSGISETVKSVTLRQNIQAEVTKSTTLRFDVLTEVTKILTLRQDILAQVSKSLSLLFDVESSLTSVTKSLSLLFSGIGQTTKSTSLRFNVQREVTKSVTLRYDVLAEAMKSLTVLFDVESALFSVTKTLSLLFSGISQTTKSTTLKFSGKQEITKSLDLKFNIYNEILKTVTIRFDGLTAIEKSLTLRQDILGQATKTLTLRQNIMAEVEKDVTLLYGILQEVPVVSKTLRFNIYQQVTKDLTLLADIQQSIIKSVRIRFDVRSVKAQNMAEKLLDAVKSRYNMPVPPNNDILWHEWYNGQNDICVSCIPIAVIPIESQSTVFYKKRNYVCGIHIFYRSFADTNDVNIPTELAQLVGNFTNILNANRFNTGFLASIDSKAIEARIRNGAYIPSPEDRDTTPSPKIWHYRFLLEIIYHKIV